MTDTGNQRPVYGYRETGFLATDFVVFDSSILQK